MLDRLIEQMHWANNGLIGWLEAGNRTEPDLLHLASHILNAETLWMKRIRTEPWTREEAFRPVPLSDMREKNRRNRAEYQAVLRDDLDKVVAYHLMDGTPGESRIRDILLHVVTHGFHHRGQLAAKAAALGSPLPNLAYIHFTRMPDHGKSP